MLREVRELDTVADPAQPAADDRVEQRRLAGAVRSDEGDVLAALEHELGVLEQRLVACGERDLLGLEHHSAAARGLEELEAQRPALALRRLDAHLLDPRDLLQLRLCLPGFRAVAEAGDEALEARDVLGLPLGLLRLQRGPCRLLLPPDVPLAREVDRLAGLELEHRCRHGLEEPAVVRDDHDGGVDRRQLLLEPLDRGHVEVVRGLVEQEQIRLAGERAGERRARQLAAGERLEAAIEIGVGEAEAAQDAGRVVAPAVAARVLEPPLGLAVAAQRLGRVVAGRPSPPPAGAAPARRRRGPRRRRARTRAACGPPAGADADRAAPRARPSPRRARRPAAPSRR